MEHTDDVCPSTRSVETVPQHSDLGAAGCWFEEESDDCHCGWCQKRYQVTCFGLVLKLGASATKEELCDSIEVAVREACVCFETERGINLVVSGMIRERYSRVFVSTAAWCVQSRLEKALRREMQPGTAVEVVVDTSGWGPYGRTAEFESLALWVRSLWKGTSLEEDEEAGLTRLGESADHVENVEIFR